MQHSFQFNNAVSITMKKITLLRLTVKTTCCLARILIFDRESSSCGSNGDSRISACHHSPWCKAWNSLTLLSDLES